MALQFALAYEKVSIPKQIWLPIIASALYGVSDEVHQIFVPGRTASIDDWIADVVGAILTIPFAHIIRKIQDFVQNRVLKSI